MRRHWGMAVLVVAMLVLAGCDWSQFGFSGANTFYNPVEPALTESAVTHLHSQWSVPCVCYGGSPLVKAGVVYHFDGYGPTNDGTESLTLRARDASNGQVKWSRPLGLTAPTKRLAAVANGLVYISVQAPSPALIAVDAQTGAVRWQVTPPAPGQGAIQSFTMPVVGGPLIFVDALSSGGTSEISAIDVDGHVVWSAVPGGLVRGLTIGNHTVYVASRVDLTAPPYGINLITGYADSDGKKESAVIPSLDNETPIDSLGFSDGLLYGTLTSGHDTDGGVTFAVHPDTGAAVWSTTRPGGRDFITEHGITADAVITDHLTGDPTTANDAHTGALLWRDTESAGVRSIAGDLVYLTEEDFLRILRVSDGALVAHFRLPGAPLFEGLGGVTPSAGRLYIGAAAHLYALAPA